MEIHFECTHCKEVKPISIVALSAKGFGLQCSVCKTYFTFGVVAVEYPLAPDGAGRAVTLSGLYNCQVCGKEKCIRPGICKDCLTPPTAEQIAQMSDDEGMEDKNDFYK